MSRAERLEALLDAAARVLGQPGGPGLTMRRVAEEADVGLATLYHYLAGREDLLYQVQMRVLAAAVTSAEAALAGRGARERLKALLTDHIRRVLARPMEADVLAGRLGPLVGERGRRVEALRREYLAVVGAATAGATRNPRRAGEHVQMLLGMADRLALDAGTGVPGRLAARILALFLDGALSRKPRRHSSSPNV